MKKAANWIGHLLWLLGRLYIEIASGNNKGMKECYSFARAHLKKRSALKRMKELTTKQKAQQVATKILGLVITVILIIGILAGIVTYQKLTL